MSDLSSLLLSLKARGCVPGIYLRGDMWRAHVNRCGNYWADAATPYAALSEAAAMWFRADCPRDGQAAVEDMIVPPVDPVVNTLPTPLRRGETKFILSAFVRVQAGEFTAPMILRAAREAHPHREITRSAVRGYLGRLVKSGRIIVTHEGTRGSADPKRYRLAEDSP